MPEEDQVCGLLDIESENSGVTTSTGRTTVVDSSDLTAQSKEDIPIQQGVDWQYIKNEII
jgi:hypothetical protein